MTKCELTMTNIESLSWGVLGGGGGVGCGL